MSTPLRKAVTADNDVLTQVIEIDGTPYNFPLSTANRVDNLAGRGTYLFRFNQVTTPTLGNGQAKIAVQNTGAASAGELRIWVVVRFCEDPA